MKNSEKPVSKNAQHKPSIPTADQQDTQRVVVRIVKEKVGSLVCYARDLHGVTVGKSHVSLPWCV